MLTHVLWCTSHRCSERTTIVLQVQWLHALIATIAAVAGGLLTGLLASYAAKPFGNQVTWLIMRWHMRSLRRRAAAD